MRRAPRLTVPLLAGATLGCGQVTSDSLSSPGDGASAPPVDGLCLSAGWTNPGRPVLIARGDSGYDFLLADGSRTVAHAFSFGDSVTSFSWSIIREGVVGILVSFLAEEGPVREGSVYQPDGTFLYSFRVTLPPTAARNVIPPGIAGPHGLVFHNPDTGDIAMLRGGEPRDLAGLHGLTPPDADGWLRAWAPQRGYGFVRVGEPATQLLSYPLWSDSDSQVGIEDRWVYLGRTPDGPALVVESHDHVATMPLPLQEPQDLALLHDDETTVVVTAAGIPRFCLALEAEQLVELAAPDPDAFAQPEVHLGEGWALLTDAGLPVWRFDLTTGSGQPLTPPAVDLDPSEIEIESEGAWFVASNASLPLWWVDARQGTVLAVEPPTAEGYRAFEAAGICSIGTSICPDGSFAMALRNDERARLFVGPPTDGTWRRTGHDVRSVRTVRGTCVAGTWLVEARAADDGTCDATTGPWTGAGAGTGAGDGPATLSGASKQIVTVGDPEPLVLEGANEVSIHESGRCALVGYQDGPSELIDLGTRARTDVGTDRWIWLR